jgi:hypothetical protein
MKHSSTDDRDDALSELLHTWKPDAQLHPRFQEAVWRRIEHGEASPKVRLWQQLAARIEAALARPALATAYIAILLSAGLAVGYWHGEGRAAHAQSEWRMRYIAAVDPFQMPR